MALTAATEDFKNAQRDADAALSGAENVAGRDRDLAVNAINKADTDAAIEREKTRTITHWNTFNTYAPQQGQAETDWAAAIKAASTDFKQALLLAEDVFIRALVSGQLERSLVALYTAHEGQRASQTATYAEDLATVTAVRVADLARELSTFGTVDLQMPPAVTLAMEAERRSTRPSGFFAAVESSLNTLTGGLSRRILLSPGFTRILNAVDGLFAGWAHALTMGLSTRVRTAMWGETATRNHQGEWFNLGTQIGEVHSTFLMLFFCNSSANVGHASPTRTECDREHGACKSHSIVALRRESHAIALREGAAPIGSSPSRGAIYQKGRWRLLRRPSAYTRLHS